MTPRSIMFLIGSLVIIASAVFAGAGDVVQQYFWSDQTKTTLQGPPNRYIRVGKGGATALPNVINSADDLLVTGDLEVLGETFIGAVSLPPQFAGFTTGTHHGSVGGYLNADTLCATDYGGSHVCRVDDILRMINAGALMGGGGEGWVNGGPPGYTANANDCQGWTASAEGNYGRYWDFATTQGWLRGCQNLVAFACCKS